MHDSLQTILDGDYCVGCGACAYLANGLMRLNKFGEYQPSQAVVNSEATASLAEACPFLSPHLNEDVLATSLFSSCSQKDENIGYYESLFAGYVSEGRFREAGTSGGMGTWIGVELLKHGIIDGVIHVRPVAERDATGPLFAYAISNTIEEVCHGAQSRYHVVELSGVLKEVRARPGKYLFIGVPCMCKALRRLQRIDATLRDRIVLAVSLVCGHLKSVNWTLSLAWSAGIHPNALQSFQYRVKGNGIPSREYVFRATSHDAPDQPVQMASRKAPGGKFNSCAMMLNACDFCDDVMGETADLTIGDAWLPRFDLEPQGTNLLIVRNRNILPILHLAQKEKRLYLESLSASEVASAQAGGLRHRREGLAYRLNQAKLQGKWTPTKRQLATSPKVSWLRRKLYDARTAVARQSRHAFVNALTTGDFKVYRAAMRIPLWNLLIWELSSSLGRILVRRLRRLLMRMRLIRRAR